MVSGMRSAVQIEIAAATTAMKMKIMCHSENSMITWPTPGAMTGITMNTMNTSDMTSAMRRPPNTSRTNDTAMTRVAAAPMPWIEAKAKQHGEARCKSRRERRGDIDGEPEEQGTPPSEAVRDRAIEQLRAAEAQYVGADHILPVVLVLDAKTGADLLQAGQHDVDGQRIERHQRGCHRDELPPRNRQREAGLRRRSFLVHDASLSSKQTKMRRLGRRISQRADLNLARFAPKARRRGR